MRKPWKFTTRKLKAIESMIDKPGNQNGNQSMLAKSPAFRYEITPKFGQQCTGEVD